MRIVGILCLVAMVLACTSEEERAHQHRERANEYYANEEWSEAKIEFLNLLQLNPDDSQSHYRMAETLWNLGDYAEGLWQYKEAVRLEPDNIEYRLKQANQEFLARRYDVVREAVDEVLKRDSENLEALNLRAKVSYFDGELEAQLADLDRVLILAPKNVDALKLKSQALFRQGDRDGAELLLKRLIEVDPSRDNYLGLGNFYATADQMDEALAQYQAAVEVAELGGDRTLARMFLANFHLLSKDPNSAEAQLLLAREEEPDNPEILQNLARFYARSGQIERAEKMLEERASKLPDDPAPLLILAEFHRRVGNIDKAHETIERALKVDPQSERARLTRASYVIERSGGTPEAMEEARTVVQKILEENPSSVLGLFTEAKFLLVEGQLDESASRLRQVLQEQPNANAHVLLGTIYIKQAQSELARSEFLQALQLDADNPFARSQLAALYLQQGERELAAQEARAALESRPGDVRMWLILADALAGLGRTDDALSALNGITLKDDASDSVRLTLSEGYLRLDQFERAREILTSLDDHASKPELIRQLALIDVQEKKIEASLARLDEGIKAHPDSALLYALRGDIRGGLRRNGEIMLMKEAESDLNTAIEKDPDLINSYISLAKLYRLTNRNEDAAATYRRAIEKLPSVPSLHLEIAQIYEILGDKSKARESYETTLRLDQESAVAMNNLAWILADSDSAKAEDLDRALVLAQDAKERMPQSPEVADTLGWVLYRKNIPTAAISLFREAIEGYPAGSAIRATVRYHLAQTYELNGELDRALEELKRSLDEAAEFGSRAEAEKMLARLQAG